MDMQRGFAVIHFASQHIHLHTLFIGASDFGVEHLVAAVEKLHGLARAHAQYAAYMVRGFVGEGDFVACGDRFRVIDARDAHSQYSI
ncbi:hypothetical protein D3C81_2164640 [compost metagenome]